MHPDTTNPQQGQEIEMPGVHFLFLPKYDVNSHKFEQKIGRK